MFFSSMKVSALVMRAVTLVPEGTKSSYDSLTSCHSPGTNYPHGHNMSFVKTRGLIIYNLVVTNFSASW